MTLYAEIEKTFPAIENVFIKKNLLEFKNTQPELLYLYHLGLGTWIRNRFLYDKSELHHAFVEDGILDIDEMSMQVIVAFHLFVNFGK